MREHGLYQADWLMRFYGFRCAEIGGRAGRQLDLEIDPKLAWALGASRRAFPSTSTRAEREMLLRVPGLGVRSVDRMLRRGDTEGCDTRTCSASAASLRRSAAFHRDRRSITRRSGDRRHRRRRSVARARAAGLF